MEFEYITIEHIGTSPSGKTDRYVVVNKKHGHRLGEIYWFGAWRQYVFEPVSETLFSCGCLDDISSFLDTRTKEQRKRVDSLAD